MDIYSAQPLAPLKSLLSNRNMIYLFAKRDIVLRYRGSMLGILWSILSPLFMLMLYSFLYGIILKVKWGNGESQMQFALIIFSGLFIYNFFSDCVSRSATIIVSNTNYVKKIVFPLEIFPYIVMASALFQLSVGFVVWLVFYLLLNGLPHITVLYFPVLLMPLMLFVLGLAWFFSAIGVYIRDVAQAITIVLSALMLITPIFFPLSAVPEAFQSLFYLNPLTYILEQMRAILIFGLSPNWINLSFLTVGYAVFAWLGFAWFQKTRKGFADVL